MADADAPFRFRRSRMASRAAAVLRFVEDGIATATAAVVVVDLVAVVFRCCSSIVS